MAKSLPWAAQIMARHERIPGGHSGSTLTLSGEILTVRVVAGTPPTVDADGTDASMLGLVTSHCTRPAGVCGTSGSNSRVGDEAPGFLQTRRTLSPWSSWRCCAESNELNQ